MHRIYALAVLAALALGGEGAPAATAAAATHGPAAAMRKGVRDYASSIDVHAGRVAITCGAAGPVGHRAPCHGTFTLSNARAASTYRLSGRSRVLRISPNAFEYRIVADVHGARAAGLPAHIEGFSGTLQ